MARKIFVNLAVKDLPKSKAFFGKLGFEFNAQFTGDEAACMVISEEAFVMLLTEKHFKQFTKKAIVDSTKGTEAILALSAESRQAVDQMVKAALESGGAGANEPQDLGFMYGGSFYDPDGHLWEVMWMEPAHIQK